MLPSFTTSGGGGDGYSVTSTTSEETNVITTQDDPFSGGLTGSEIMAEGGAASSTYTIDSGSDNIQDEIRENGGVEETLAQIEELAADGDDSNSTPTFDNVSNNQEGQQALRDTVQTVVDAAGSMDPNQSDAPTQAENAAAQNAENVATPPASAGGSGPGGILGMILAAITALLGALLPGGN